MNDIETRVLEAIGEDTDSPDVFDSTGIDEIRASINDAIQEICLVTASKRRKWIIPLQSGKNFYRIYSEQDIFGWPVSVWLVNQKRRLDNKSFAWIARNNPQFLKVTATPLRYTIIGKETICLDPTPSADGDAIMIDAVAIPSRYTEDTDPIKVRDVFQHALVHYAVSEFWASRGDAKTALWHIQRYSAKLGVAGIYPETRERWWRKESQ